ncbi:YdeI/OmpD-associated family protein [Pontibacter cellulosilyticus]|uniref:YdeI/OmpD-associated family protein n=1 Tax=Pontibacter cellulosilyticus TaxID=1720253 RepID=A0A923SKL6_9BACT|nr:YdeI/OmpD-associated family protein [Pontibacter cellulosilyticus]MBC5993911.1 YdeI/OmpD-associated family protein [Pontibacter cellulosilyticus]
MAEIGKKLQLKHTYSLLLLNAPDQIADALATEGYTFTNAAETPHVGTYDAVQIFVRNKDEMDHFVPQVVLLLKPNALFWVAYPKKSSGIKTDLSRDEGWKTVAALGYEATRLVALGDTWSSARFRHKTERSKPSTFGMDMPGIDRKAKTVVLPEDVQQALEQADLLEVFNQMAFTHRKEYVVAVLDAKRPETRAKRIQKIIDDLQARKQKV